MAEYMTVVWSSYGHIFVSSDAENTDQCLTCGAHYLLIPDPKEPHRGLYVANDGRSARHCTYRADLVHGYERHCENDNGRSCQPFTDEGECEHTEHDCICVLCE